MRIEIKAPEVGESVEEALLAQWYKREGDFVKKDEILFLIETDKVTLEIVAPEDGYLKILTPEGETVKVGSVVGFIETEVKPREKETPKEPMTKEEKALEPEAPPGAAERQPTESPVVSRPAPAEAKTETGAPALEEALAPSVRRLMDEKGVDASVITAGGPGGRITRGDVLLYLEEESERKETEPPRRRTPEEKAPVRTGAPEAHQGAVEEDVTRKPMSKIRQRIAERLLEAKQNTAMLTTFNEVDMSRVQALRSRFKDAFREKHGAPLGIMSFFIKAAVAALKEFPEINAYIDEKDIVYHHYYHIGVAIGAERGLVVPVIRHADRLSFANLERAIIDFVDKIKDNRLGISDLEGGTFTISNGGVYGSLLSTPILNPPQSAILGMHKIEQRPVVVSGEIVIRPMMYVALSYDHRIVDGREAVGFLKRIKECVENPERIMMEI